MQNDLTVKDGKLDSKVLDELYYEALDLSSLVVEYFQENKKENFQHLDINIIAFYTLECNRITSGIMQAMSWCLMQKGVRSGEVTIADAAQKKSRLSNNEHFADPIGCDTSEFPEEFIKYSERTRDLYARIVRLDRLLYENDENGENPVHNLMDKIEKM